MGLESLSDWVSSLSTAGTLVVAYMAYKKAPEWLNQKMHEDALSIAKKLIFDDYPSINKVVWKAGGRIHYFTTLYDFISDDLGKLINSDECDDNLSIFHDIPNIPITIRDTFSNLTKLGWNVTQEITEINNKIEIHYKGIHKHYVMTWIGIKKILSEEKPHVKEAYLKTLSKNLESFQYHEKEFDLYYEKLQRSYKRIPHYFNIEKC
ncbi:hypothetical protein [Serratia plymuthica]|uniref:hypothetical protein n=1 Tax=Serratia plymuthica TaxID=82996 RepID=UPI00390C6644